MFSKENLRNIEKKLNRIIQYGNTPNYIILELVLDIEKLKTQKNKSRKKIPVCMQ